MQLCLVSLHLCLEHNIYDCLCKDTTQVMFRENAKAIAPKKDNVVVNMVLTVTTCDQITKNVVFKEKEPFKNKSLAN